MPAGRPTKYDPSFAGRVIELGKQGKSPAQIASALGVARSSLSEWASVYPEFSAAITRARDEAQAWWETVGQENLSSREFNGHLWIKTMQARFRDDYTDRRHLDHTIASEAAESKSASDKDLARAVAFILAKGAAEKESELAMS